MAEPIEMLFGLWARMCEWYHVNVRRGPEVLQGVAMATNFGTQFAITASVAIDYGEDLT